MHKNTRLLVILACVALGMLGVAYAFVPLYRMFCQVFGTPVPTVLTKANAAMPGGNVPDGRVVTVRFIGNSAAGVPIRFTPMTFSMKVPVGEPVLTAYRAINTSPRPLDGVAVHMVYGMGETYGNDDMLPYIDLQQCFCFELQHYPGSSDIRLPLSFTVRPDLPQGVHTLTFSYTLFEALPDDPRIKQHSEAKL